MKAPRSKGKYDYIVLVLQGGGALGAYQAGVFEAMAEASLAPNWVAGVSIGAVNGALIVGNPVGHRTERLREFWNLVSSGLPGNAPTFFDPWHSAFNRTSALLSATFGVPGFYAPRIPPPELMPDGAPGALSVYDASPLRQTLERMVDFDLLNCPEAVRYSAGAVHVASGNSCYFDNARDRIEASHVMASAALPPAFAAVEIKGEAYWDGGIVSNTPLQWVLDAQPREDTLAFQVDLWSARGELPRDMIEVDVRQKDIRYSSRTRKGTDEFRRMQSMRRAAAKLLDGMHPELRQTPEAEMLAQEADSKVYNIVHLIYHARRYEGSSKDYEFSRRTMEEHWQSGYSDMERTLRHPEVLQRPQSADGVFTFDLKTQGRQ